MTDSFSHSPPLADYSLKFFSSLSFRSFLPELPPESFPTRQSSAFSASLGPFAFFLFDERFFEEWPLLLRA